MDHYVGQNYIEIKVKNAHKSANEFKMNDLNYYYYYMGYTMGITFFFFNSPYGAEDPDPLSVGRPTKFKLDISICCLPMLLASTILSEALLKNIYINI